MTPSQAEVERRIVKRETVGSTQRPAAAALSSLATGDVVGGRYLITRLIGRGGIEPGGTRPTT